MKRKPVDYMQRTVSVTLPKAPAGEPQSLFVGLNHKNYLIPRGKRVNLPLPVWEIIRMSMRAEEQMDAALRKE